MNHKSRENSATWNGGRIKTHYGYIKILLSGHPRTDTKGYVYEHILVAEKSLGKYLPSGAEIHHINEIKDDNRPENLIICQNRSYHWLIHQRQRAFKASGDPNKRKCSICKKYDSQGNLFQCGTWFFHKSCKNKKARDNYIPKGRRIINV
jgi:hypothetical protein